MSKRQEANAHYKSREGQPLLSKGRQVRDGDGGRGCSGTWGRVGGRELQPGLAPGLALGTSWCQNGLAEGIAQRQRAQLGIQPSLAAVLCICLGARAGLADVRKDSVPTRLPPSHASSCFPQVLQRLPQAAAEVTLVTVHRDRHVPRQDTSSASTRPRTWEDSLECGHSLPHSGTVTQPPRLSVSDLSPLHGPPLTVTPLCWLSPEMPRAASARVKMPPLPAAPAASGSSPTGRAWSMGPVARGYQDLVPTSPWGTMAADRARLTPSPDSSIEGLWRGSATRQGHGLSPLRRAGGTPHRTGSQPAWMHLGHAEMQELTEVQREHGSNTYRVPFRGLALCLREERSTKSTGPQEQLSVCQETDAEPQVMHRAPGLCEDSTADTGTPSELRSCAQLPQQQSVPDNSQCLETSPKEPEENWEEEELPETKAEGEGNGTSQSASLAPLREEEAATSPLEKGPWDKWLNELFPMSEHEEHSDFTASPSYGSLCEERGTNQLLEQTAHGKLLCTGSEDASKHLLHIEAEELEKLEEDLLSSLDQERPSVPHSLCSWIMACAGETENYSQLMVPDLFEELWSLFNDKDVPSRDARIDQLLAKWEEGELPDRDAAGEGDSEPESVLCATLQDEEAEPASCP
ncbi:hypothetical protein DUI87_06959 [Hirundo rustica rustica]|uniref:Uncharacterized protein n=1 Tax=Hirundo rustica rustica TaxID=333673 RepID=A0A3M0KP03_HIRRU|nr:hypothetical protein DUI87_06959 [Hirundo rustica rustica]